jgi:hypothetical protein
MLSSILRLSSENLEVGRNPLVFSLDAFRRICQRPGQPRDLATSPQGDHPSFSHLAIEMRQSGRYPAPFYQLLGRWSNVSLEPAKKSPTFRPASRASSRSLSPSPSYALLPACETIETTRSL